MYADTVVDEAHAYPSGSVKSQLSTWHADSSKGFLWNMIPKWHNPPTGEGPTTKNPFKLLAMVGPMGWLYFFSGESEMSEEGETGHNFFISRPISLVFGSFSSFFFPFFFFLNSILIRRVVRMDMRRLRFLRCILDGIAAGEAVQCRHKGEEEGWKEKCHI